MDEIINFFNEFLKSEFVKNHIAGAIVIGVLLIAVGAFLMWLYMIKFHMLILRNKNQQYQKQIADLESDKATLKKELEDEREALKDVKKTLDDLLVQSDKLSFYNEITEAEKYADEIAPAIEQFIQD